jgi:hypothetical protein
MAHKHHLAAARTRQSWTRHWQKLKRCSARNFWTAAASRARRRFGKRSPTDSPCESAVAAALCQRSPKAAAQAAHFPAATEETIFRACPDEAISAEACPCHHRPCASSFPAASSAAGCRSVCSRSADRKDRHPVWRVSRP